MKFDIDGRTAYAYTGGKPLDPKLPLLRCDGEVVDRPAMPVVPHHDGAHDGPVDSSDEQAPRGVRPLAGQVEHGVVPGADQPGRLPQGEGFLLAARTMR